MREFLLNSGNRLDPRQIEYMNHSGQSLLLPCVWIRFNDRMKLAFFPDGCTPVSALLPGLSVDEVCQSAKVLLDYVMTLEQVPEITLENMVWDMDAIYLTDDLREMRLLYLPVEMPDEVRESHIYVRRIYAVIEEMLERVEGGDTIIRQVEFQKEQAMGDWSLLKNALDKRIPEQSDRLVLRGQGDLEAVRFEIGQETFRIGSDHERVRVFIDDADQIDPVHAVIGWNDISFYVMDLGSRNGTYVNDTQIAPNTQVPIGSGSILRLAGYAFEIE
ncbi:MAG: FHA domain-containing protein [Eubacterium sp.]|nr:FHA domain-containing protein [Eubacterium sp.]